MPCTHDERNQPDPHPPRGQIATASSGERASSSAQWLMLRRNQRNVSNGHTDKSADVIGSQHPQRNMIHSGIIMISISNTRFARPGQPPRLQLVLILSIGSRDQTSVLAF